MAEITTIPSNDYEEIAVWRDPDADLTAAAAIHSTVRGPAIGGTRWLPYAGLDEALTDVRRLAEAMTLKSATARLPFGGGKAVVLGDPAEKTDAQLRSYAEFVNQFEGRFLTTTDVGTTTAEVDQLAQWTPHMVGKSEALGGSGDTSALTATTVLAGIAATLEALDGDPSAEGRTIVILGVGKVGSRVARALAEQGARLLLADIRAIGAAALAAGTGRTDGLGRRRNDHTVRSVLAKRTRRAAQRGDDSLPAGPLNLRRGQQSTRSRSGRRRIARGARSALRAGLRRELRRSDLGHPGSLRLELRTSPRPRRSRLRNNRRDLRPSPGTANHARNSSPGLRRGVSWPQQPPAEVGSISPLRSSSPPALRGEMSRRDRGEVGLNRCGCASEPAPLATRPHPQPEPTVSPAALNPNPTLTSHTRAYMIGSHTPTLAISGAEHDQRSPPEHSQPNPNPTPQIRLRTPINLTKSDQT